MKRQIGQKKNGAPVYVLTKPLPFRMWNWVSEVPTGFPTDLASTPKFLWRWFPPDGPWARAAIIHDWLCVLTDNHQLAHDIFRVYMEIDGVSFWKRQVTWFIVSAYGKLMRKQWIECLEGTLRQKQKEFVK